MQKCEDQLIHLQQLAAAAENKISKLEAEVVTKQEMVDSQRSQLESVTSVNSGLGSEKSNLEREVVRLGQANEKLHDEMTRLGGECKALQQQMVAMKLAEANEVVAEKRKLLKVLDEERERFYWKENELLTKLRELQTRLVESEALAEKYQSQYEDERVHVASLRHDVASLNNLLTQAHATINAKHGVAGTSQRNVKLNSVDTGMHAFPPPAPSASSYDGMLMMKMMEMMTALQGSTAPAATRPLPVSHAQTTVNDPAGLGSREPVGSLFANEDHQLKEEQQRREREMLEQRAYEKRQKERMEEEERLLLARRKEFEDEMAHAQLKQKEEAERADAARKAKLTEEEGELKEQLALQQKAIEAAREEQQRLDRLRVEESERRANADKEEEERRQLVVQRQAAEEEARLQKEREAAQMAEKARAEAMAKELEEIQKRCEQLDALDEERRRMAQDREEVETRRRELGVEVQRQREAAAQLIKQESTTVQSSTVESTGQNTPEKSSIGTIVDASADSKDSSTKTATEGLLVSHQPADIDQDGDQREAKMSDDQGSGGKVEIATADISGGAGIGNSTQAGLELVEIKNADDHKENSHPSQEIPGDVDTSVVALAVSTGTEAITETQKEAAPQKTEEELEEEKKRLEEEQKRKQDDDVIDVYRQRVLARKAAEKQRQQELEAEKKQKEDEEKKAAAELAARQSFQGSGDGSDNELELSDGSFAESRYAAFLICAHAACNLTACDFVSASAASSADSF